MKMKRLTLLILSLLLFSIVLTPTLGDVTVDVYIDSGLVKLTYENNSATFNSYLNNTHLNFTIPVGNDTLGTGCIADIQSWLLTYKEDQRGWMINELKPRQNEFDGVKTNMTKCEAQVDIHDSEIDAKDAKISSLEEEIKSSETINYVLLVITLICIIALMIIGAQNKGLIPGFGNTQGKM